MERVENGLRGGFIRVTTCSMCCTRHHGFQSVGSSIVITFRPWSLFIAVGGSACEKF